MAALLHKDVACQLAWVAHCTEVCTGGLGGQFGLHIQSRASRLGF